MEDYMLTMKLLRSQMNDLEDQVVTIAVEEQKHITEIRNMEKDLDLVKSETIRVKEEIERMKKAKGQTCSQILEKQKKIASLQTDTSTTSQALELINQERTSLSARINEKRSYYTKVVEEMNSKLQEQQEDWMRSNKLHMGEVGLVEGNTGEAKGKFEDKSTTRTHTIAENLNFKDLMTKVDAATARLDEISAKKSDLVLKNSKMQESIKQLQCRAAEFPSVLREMDMQALEEELKALLSDKEAETEYLHSLKDKIEQLKGISQLIRCACGVEYKVEM
ncbi:golgin subfamily A member 4 [Macadamia integrifolia]|uniref:golgin subfamily A member 4 n=1 Tax=Macadamia integrifolia TaxID=60698 RepID=UPI001C4F9E44|nr:golgin subfamily A member 4 [Macadamia integrifolia]